MIRKITSHSVTLIKVGLLTAAIVATLVHFSDFHHSYIRYAVGSEVVEILKEGEGGGTGFHVKAKSGQTYILTNAHVCEMSKNKEPLSVFQEGTETSIPRNIIYVSKKHDLCLLEPLPGHSGISLASQVDIGESITIAGHPQLRPLTLEEGELINKDAKVTIPKSICLNDEQKKNCEGEVVSVPSIFGVLDVCVSIEYAYQAKLIAYPGNSGSPVVNKWGHVVGVLFAGGSAITDSYLIKLEFVKELLDIF